MQINAEGSELVMRIWDNWHAHYRQGHMLRFLTGLFLEHGWRGRIVAEPNTKPPKLTGSEALAYAKEIRMCAIGFPHGQLMVPVPVMQITERTTGAVARRAYDLGVRVFKVYPFFVTTNSENGVINYEATYPALAELEGLPGVVVQFHSETPRFEIDGRLKEEEFLKNELAEILKRFPNLVITVEHISSAFGVEWVKSHAKTRKIGASVTVQHLYNTADDVLGYSRRSGGLVRVHDAFKPHAKDIADREAIRNVVAEGHPCFFYGGDDAWHLIGAKECDGACCGAANSIAAPSLIIQFFEERKILARSEPFVSEYGARFYGYPLNEGVIRFLRKSSRVPREVSFIGEDGEKKIAVPWYAGEELLWQVAA